MESRVGSLEAWREGHEKRLDEMDRKLDELIKALSNFRGSIKVALWVFGIIGTVLGWVFKNLTTKFLGGT